MSKWNVIPPADPGPVQLELFADLPRFHIVNEAPMHDIMHGGTNALQEIGETCETLVLVGYLIKGGVNIYTVGRSPTIERTVWMLDKAKYDLHEMMHA